tara:strand:+ start:980 stop:1486 length:507 start_codon:yes stop_codon:yes gene_type:complete
MKISKLDNKIHELNTIIDFIENNILDDDLQYRYIKVLRFQKALVRDIDRKGRKVPEITPIVCEVSGREVGSIREKEPNFRLKQDIPLKLHQMNLGEHNSYSHILGNYSIKSMKKLLGRKVRFDDFLNDTYNVSFLMQCVKHKDYYKKYVDMKSISKNIDVILGLVEKM